MRSPFPGMDPWLEPHWRDVHTALMVYARDALQEQLPGDLFARVEEGVAVDDGDVRRPIAPDVRVVEAPESGGWPIAPVESGIAVAEPIVVPVLEETERHIEIIDSSGKRVITAIEFLSPTNKTPYEGQSKYVAKQREYLAAGVNLVEVDLIRDGVFTVAAPKERIPRRSRRTYCACVRRAIRPWEARVYPMSLRERLPAIPIPLRPTDRDVALDLQKLLNDCYLKGRYGATIDYTEELDPPLTGADARWADELLQAAGRKT